MSNEIEVSKLSFHSWEKEIFSKDIGADYDALKEDIKERGVQTPIHISPSEKIGEIKPHTIIAGHRRVRACKELGIKKIPYMELPIKSENDINAAFLYDNVLRRELDLIQSVLVYNKLLEVETIKAKERLKTNIGGKRGLPMAKLPQAGLAADFAASKLAKSRRTMEERVKAYNYLKADQELLEEWNKGIYATIRVLDDMKAAEKQPKLEQLENVPYEPTEEKEPHETEKEFSDVPKSMKEAEPIVLEPIDFIKRDLERTIEILENKEYTGKHKHLINAIYILCKKVVS